MWEYHKRPNPIQHGVDFDKHRRLVASGTTSGAIKWHQKTNEWKKREEMMKKVKELVKWLADVRKHGAKGIGVKWISCELS